MGAGSPNAGDIQDRNESIVGKEEVVWNGYASKADATLIKGKAGTMQHGGLGKVGRKGDAQGSGRRVGRKQFLRSRRSTVD